MKYTFAKSAPKDPSVARVRFTEESDAQVREGKQTILEIATGKPGEMTRRKLVTAVRKIVSSARLAKKKKVACDLSDLVFPHLGIDMAELAELFTTNMELANFEFTEYKTKPKEGFGALKEVVILGKADPVAQKGVRKGKTIGEEVNGARRLANTPGGDMTPEILSESARVAVEGLPVEVTVLSSREMKELGMGGILGVGRGSIEEPKFIVMEYRGGAESERPVVLVGKGVTFDSGGLNLKPSDGIYEMHMDMTGGATVIHAIALSAKLKLKKNIVALIPAVENMPSGSSYHPGDVLRSMSGKTIEVLNTDAEGRIILADALHFAKKYQPRLVVDVATLTGASMVALGNRASALFTRAPELETLFRHLGEESGDYVWPLPLWDEYEQDIKGTFGDWANTGKGRLGGAITGAMFLYQFTKDEKGRDAYPWVHLDIAPRMTSTEGDVLAKGSTGEPVRLLARLLEQY